MCTAKVLRDYFVHGVVPESGTVCVADEGTLFPPGRTAAGVEILSDGDRALKAALHELSRVPAEF